MTEVLHNALGLLAESMERWRDVHHVHADDPAVDAATDLRFAYVRLGKCPDCRWDCERRDEWFWCGRCRAHWRVVYDPQRHADEVGRFVVQRTRDLRGHVLARHRRGG